MSYSQAPRGRSVRSRTPVFGRAKTEPAESRCFALVTRVVLVCTIHRSQSRAEVDFMVRHHGMRPPAFLAKHGFLGPRLFAAHCRYVDDGDIAFLGKSGTIISHQAGMAANRGVIPPIPALRAAGCPIANGTDNNTNDMFEVMRIAQPSDIESMMVDGQFIMRNRKVLTMDEASAIAEADKVVGGGFGVRSR
jgi:cytosine/adenosine deaminase-related metal-dependent hydrolase